MKIKELEPWVIMKGLKPKHIILSKGSNVKWMVCIREVDDEKSQIIIYDADGKAYASIERTFEEIFFDIIRISKDHFDDAVFVNYILCGHIKEYDLKQMTTI